MVAHEGFRHVAPFSANSPCLLVAGNSLRCEPGPGRRAGGAPATPTADGEMLNSIKHVRGVMRGMVETEVRAAVRNAHERMATDPEGVMASLAAESARVRLAPELNPADRDRLLAYLFAASREGGTAVVDRAYVGRSCSGSAGRTACKARVCTAT